MKRILVLVGLLLISTSAFAATTYDNFTGYSAYWHPLGYPNTATYGETFTAPTNGNNALQNFGFYLAGPYQTGDIILGGYIAPWTGSNAGTPLYTSPSVDYPNTGNAELTFNTGGLALTPGASYVAFLSVSQYYGQSSGESYISQGDTTIPGGAFVYYNNGGNFSALSNSTWNATGLTPNWAFTATFTPSAPAVPEPSTLILLVSGLIGLVGLRRFKK